MCVGVSVGSSVAVSVGVVVGVGALTVVSAAAPLLPGAGSLVSAVTLAVLVMPPGSDGAVTVIVMSGAAPTARLARVQVTVPSE